MFLPPKFPEEKEEEDEDEEQGDEDSSYFINGIETREIRDSPEASANKRTGQWQDAGRIEETKINFFDPTRFGKRKEVELYDMEKSDDEMIIEGKLDPNEWQRELDKVFPDLDNLEKDLEIIR